MSIPFVHLPLRRQAVWVVTCRIVGVAATLASNILAARLLGPAEFGAYLLVTTVIALGGLLAMAGLNEAALRFISESLALGKLSLARAYVRRTLSRAGISSAIASIVVTVGFAALVLATRNSSQPAALLALVAVGIAVLAWQQLGAELLRAFGDLRLASLFSGGQTGGPVSNLLFLAGLCAATFAAAKIDATLAVGITVASLCLTCPLVYVGLSRVSRAPGPGAAGAFEFLSPQQNRELLTVGGVLLLNQLLAFAAQQLDIWLAGGLLTSEALGLYGAAKRSLLVAAMPVQMAMLTIVSAIPRLHAQARSAELERVVRGAANAAAIPALLGLGVLTIFPRQIMSMVFGGAYTGAETTMLVLALGHYVLVLAGNPQHVLTMTGRHRAVLAVNFASAIMLVVVGTAGAYAFGAPGLAAGSAASLILQNSVLWWLARRELGIWTHVGLSQRDRARVSEMLPQDGPAPRQPLSADLTHSPEPLPSSPA
ncbi:MAG TPA: lipopolysaccharide biosynthesis protein [Pirellulaceae bacterium]|nr:lipopolysaccharide biosynthesis protein [Pirellulaceae bacterium]